MKRLMRVETIVATIVATPVRACGWNLSPEGREFGRICPSRKNPAR
ncbi:hypothetical protein [Ruegeria arenilitoris]|nr:hypothetical protein [Ruegeria arenilitoris]